jgi:hypothetical protein
MGDSFYHIFTIPYLFLLTLFFGNRGVGIHDVITKKYHMSVITLISRKICDKKNYNVDDPSINSSIPNFEKKNAHFIKKFLFFSMPTIQSLLRVYW